MYNNSNVAYEVTLLFVMKYTGVKKYEIFAFIGFTSWKEGTQLFYDR